LSFWALIRSGGGTDAEIKALQAAQERAESESSVEDTDEIRMARVDYDELTMQAPAADQKMTLGDRIDTDQVNLDDNAVDGQRVGTPLFRFCGGDATTYVVSGGQAKNGDGYSGNGAFGNSECLVTGHGQTSGL